MKNKIFITAKILLLFSLFIVIGCKTKQNQIINNKKEGLWIQFDTLDYIYKIVGKYSKNEEVGTWKYYNNNKLVRKEKFYKNNCKTKFYHPNRKLQKKGYTKSETKNNLLHWFYYGKWKFYDLNRKFLKSEFYINGKTKDSLRVNYSEGRMNFTPNVNN